MARSEAEVRARLISGYLGAATRDVKATDALLREHDDDLASTAAYHLQQAAEKLIKAVMIARGLVVTREHRLYENLGALVKRDSNDPWIVRLQPFDIYDGFATTSRYPTPSGTLSSGPTANVMLQHMSELRTLIATAAAELKT